MKLTDDRPVDRLHRECLEARQEIRRLTNEARRRLGLSVKKYS